MNISILGSLSLRVSIFVIVGYIRILLNCYAFARCFSSKRLFAVLYFLRWGFWLKYYAFSALRLIYLIDLNVIKFGRAALFVMLWMVGVLANSTRVWLVLLFIFKVIEVVKSIDGKVECVHMGRMHEFRIKYSKLRNLILKLRDVEVWKECVSYKSGLRKMQNLIHFFFLLASASTFGAVLDMVTDR